MKKEDVFRPPVSEFFPTKQEEWKFDTLCDLYDTMTIAQAVIFVNTKKKVYISCFFLGVSFVHVFFKLVFFFKKKIRSTGLLQKCAKILSLFVVFMEKWLSKSGRQFPMLLEMVISEFSSLRIYTREEWMFDR